MKRLMILAAGALVAGSVLADNATSTGTVATDSPATVTSTSAEQDLKAELKVGTDVKDHEIVGEASSFPGDTDKVVAWTRVTGAAQPTQVFHVWKLDGKEMSKVTLNVQSASYRTYSRKSVAGNPGKWSVEVQDNSGKVLASKDFTVEAGAAPAPKAPAAPATSAPATTAPATSAPATNAPASGGTK